MYRKPNDSIINNGEAELTTFAQRNQIGRRFSKIFDVLLNPGYYEGTKYAKYFNEFDDNGKSKIYVYDPLEKELNKLIESEKNEMKYLVGLAGMGKTTLLRNFFKIKERDVIINKNHIVVYISFYYSHLSEDSPQNSIDKEITSYLSRAVSVIMSKNMDSFDCEKNFWINFYEYIDRNKPALLENESIIPSSSFFSDLKKEELTYERKLKKIQDVCSNRPIEYYSILIKYILTNIKNTEIDSIIFIYDDIESKGEVFHKSVIETARHIYSCFSATEGNELLIKSIVSLRAYTFRCNVGRQSEARREFLKNNTILKKSTVDLHEIFEKRFEAIEEIESIKKISKNKDSYNAAKNQLQYVDTQLDSIASKMVFNLSNYNISNALVLYSSIMTNLRWISCKEQEHKGAFIIDSKNYRLTTENILYAIANENTDVYIDNGTGYIPNLLKNDVEYTGIINMYIIRYMLNSEATTVLGEKYVEATKIISDITSLFVSAGDTDTRISYWKHNVNASLEHLYNSGVLLRSLYDIEITEETQIERRYSDTYKLYLSPRGECLYELLSKNAVLLELYRDDISTELKNNNKPTSLLSTDEIFEYLLDYLDSLFDFEKQNIGSAISNINIYQEYIGNEFITSTLLQGVSKNLDTYYKCEGNTYNKLVNRSNEIIQKMIDYSDALHQEYNIQFAISNDLL